MGLTAGPVGPWNVEPVLLGSQVWNRVFCRNGGFPPLLAPTPRICRACSVRKETADKATRTKAFMFLREGRAPRKREIQAAELCDRRGLAQ